MSARDRILAAAAEHGWAAVHDRHSSRIWRPGGVGLLVQFSRAGAVLHAHHREGGSGHDISAPDRAGEVLAYLAQPAPVAAPVEHVQGGRPDGTWGCACGWEQDRPHAEHVAEHRAAAEGRRLQTLLTDVKWLADQLTEERDALRARVAELESEREEYRRYAEARQDALTAERDNALAALSEAIQ